jgi:hypothetical protein
MFNTCSDSRFDAVQLFGSFAEWIVPRTLFVNQAFETTKAQQILEAFA